MAVDGANAQRTGADQRAAARQRGIAQRAHAGQLGADRFDDGRQRVDLVHGYLGVLLSSRVFSAGILRKP
jgi:hypothetical protein